MERWRILAGVAMALTAAILVILLLESDTEEALHRVLRITATLSTLLFVSAFSASGLQTLFHRPWSAWMLRNRRYVGVSFALSHLTHLAFILLLVRYYPHPFVDKLNSVTIIGGSLAYVFILFMTITSFDATRQFIGETAWKALHLIGSYYIWLIFSFSYLPRAIREPVYWPFVTLLLLSLLIRMAARLRRHRLASTD